jgi:dienelactone hydrolase
MKMQMVSLLGAVFYLNTAQAELVEKTVSYEKDGVTMEGFHVYDDSVSERRPAVLVIHQWTGLSDNEKQRARMLAQMGCNVFAADIYGKGVRPDNAADAGKLAGKFKSDRALYRSRLMAGLEVLRNDERTDETKMAAIGYCFGGTGVLEMARAGAPLAGVVSFHGGLDAVDGLAAKTDAVKSKVLVLHGADDPYVPAEQVSAFQKEFTDAKADWQMVFYSGAVHAFTQKSAGDDPSKGAAYNATADRRSWQAMKFFFAETLELTSLKIGRPRVVPAPQK